MSFLMALKVLLSLKLLMAARPYARLFGLSLEANVVPKKVVLSLRLLI
jgi:hypothetical protein